MRSRPLTVVSGVTNLRSRSPTHRPSFDISSSGSAPNQARSTREERELTCTLHSNARTNPQQGDGGGRRGGRPAGRAPDRRGHRRDGAGRHGAYERVVRPGQPWQRQSARRVRRGHRQRHGRAAVAPHRTAPTSGSSSSTRAATTVSGHSAPAKRWTLGHLRHGHLPPVLQRRQRARLPRADQPGQLPQRLREHAGGAVGHHVQPVRGDQRVQGRRQQPVPAPPGIHRLHRPALLPLPPASPAPGRPSPPRRTNPSPAAPTSPSPAAPGPRTSATASSSAPATTRP